MKQRGVFHAGEDGSSSIGDGSCNGDDRCERNQDVIGSCRENDSVPAICLPPVQDQRPPNIGAGLSGLFAKPVQQAPAPAPSAVNPNTVSPVISPPNTGDAGLADETAPDAGLYVAAAAVIASLALALRSRQRV